MIDVSSHSIATVLGTRGTAHVGTNSKNKHVPFLIRKKEKEETELSIF
jgi:hypothetical protein